MGACRKNHVPGQGKQINFHCSLSLISAIVKPKFDKTNTTRNIINPGNALVGPGLQAPMFVTEGNNMIGEESQNVKC